MDQMEQCRHSLKNKAGTAGEVFSTYWRCPTLVVRNREYGFRAMPARLSQKES
jgi:hypothetical protein